MRLWDTATGLETLLLETGGTRLASVAFSPDGSKLVSVGNDQVARVSALNLDDLLELISARLTRLFSADECRHYLPVGSCSDA